MLPVKRSTGRDSNSSTPKSLWSGMCNEISENGSFVTDGVQQFKQKT